MATMRMGVGRAGDESAADEASEPGGEPVGETGAMEMSGVAGRDALMAAHDAACREGMSNLSGRCDSGGKLASRLARRSRG